MFSNRATVSICAAAAALVGVAFTAPPASAKSITVYGSPTYTSSSSGTVVGVSDGGTAVAHALQSGAAGLDVRIFRFDASGTVTELGNLGTDSSGRARSGAKAINTVGDVVGFGRTYDGSGVFKGSRAVRWDAASTAATELGHLGTNANGYTESSADAINAIGAAVGVAREYDAAGVFQGERAVRWDDSGTAATELPIPASFGTGPGGFTKSAAVAINPAGTAIGYAYHYDESGMLNGIRGLRWDSAGAATELGHLGASPSGETNSGPKAINAAGTVVGYARRWGADGTDFGFSAVRWDASGTAATELDTLYPEAFENLPVAINDAGVAVGYVGFLEGRVSEAVRWDPSGAVTELGHLAGGDSVYNSANDINNAGVAVGDTEGKAVYWDREGVAVDLNTLIDPASGWSLLYAWTINDNGWISGRGIFDPDGPGGQIRASRDFIMQVPAAAVPEPGGLAVLSLAIPPLLRRRARR